MREHNRTPEIAVLVPCYNEGSTITTVVSEFKTALPTANVYVYDNNSSDDTIDKARAAGAIVRTETRQGKGHVVRRMFADIEADIYVLVDGDDTYEAAAAPKLVARLIDDSLDMVTGTRAASSEEAYRPGHRFGNRLLTGLVAYSFGSQVADMLSGYRVLSRRFVKSFPLLSGGFEIETEMTVHGLELGMPQAEVTTVYKERPEGSESKLNTFGDGFRILTTIVRMLKEERPFAFFGSICAILVAMAIVLAIPIVMTFLETGLVPRFPTAILATGMILLAFLSLACGLILATVTRGRQELKRLRYLQIPGVLRPSDERNN
ncbi:MAG: glycosyltransferase family 2 protein [Pseudomonadota bacterium]